MSTHVTKSMKTFKIFLWDHFILKCFFIGTSLEGLQNLLPPFKNILFICLFGFLGSLLWHAGSLVAVCERYTTGPVVAARGLSSRATRGIVFLQLRIEPMSLALESGFLTTGPPGRSCTIAFLWYSLKYCMNILYGTHIIQKVFYFF